MTNIILHWKASVGPFFRSITRDDVEVVLEAQSSIVRKASEYRQHADECRALARKLAQTAHRDQLLEMAETWERLAADREAIARMDSEPAAADDPAVMQPWWRPFSLTERRA